MAATTYTTILTKGLKANLPTPTAASKQIRLTTDSQELFIDNGTTRIQITDFVKGLTSTQIRNLQSPLDKIYLASDNLNLYYYDKTAHAWVNFSKISIDNIDEDDGLDFGDEDAES